MTMNVLLAEDDPMLQSIMIDFLEELECSVHAVTNGAKALDAVKTGDFDVVLMDCKMPVMDGITATRRLLEGEVPADGAIPPIIALTGHTDPAQHQRCLDAGMAAVLTKPVDIDELQSVLERFSARP